MRPRHAVLLTPSKFLGLSQLLSRQQNASVSPLAATLMGLPASVANKRLTVELSPLDATLTKNTGVRASFPFWNSPHVANVRPSRLALASASDSPPLLPLSPYILTSLLPCFVFDRHRDENHVTATLLDSALTNCDARNSFRMRFYENCRVSLTLSPLFSLFAQRVFHNSFALKRFRTLSRNSRVWPNSGHSGTHPSPLRPPRHRLGIEPENGFHRGNRGQIRAPAVVSDCSQTEGFPAFASRLLRLVLRRFRARVRAAPARLPSSNLWYRWCRADEP